MQGTQIFDLTTFFITSITGRGNVEEKCFFHFFRWVSPSIHKIVIIFVPKYVSFVGPFRIF